MEKQNNEDFFPIGYKWTKIFNLKFNDVLLYFPVRLGMFGITQFLSSVL